MITTTSLPEENAATLSPISASTQDIIKIALGKIEKPQKISLWSHPVSFYLLLGMGLSFFSLCLLAIGSFIISAVFSLGTFWKLMTVNALLLLLFDVLYNLSILIPGLIALRHPTREHVKVLQARIADEDAAIARLLKFDIAALQRASRRLALAREALLDRAGLIVGEIGRSGAIATATALYALYIHYRASLQMDFAYVDGVALIILGFLLGAMIGNHIASRIRVAQYLIEEAIIEKRGEAEASGS